MKLGEAYVEIRSNQSIFNRNLTAMQSHFRGVMGSMRTMALTLGPIIGGIGAGLVAKKIIDAAKDFEKALADIKAVSMELRDGVADAGKKMTQVEDMAKKLGKETKFSTIEVAEGMKFVAMAGYDVEQMLAAMPGIVNAAAAADTDLAQSADWLTNILTGFNMEAADTGRVADVISATAANANTNMMELAEGLKFLAPIAAGAGYSVEETAAMMGQLANAGLKAGIAGRNLRTNLLAFEVLKTGEVTKSQAGAFEELGIKMLDLTDTTKEMKGEFAKRGIYDVVNMEFIDFINLLAESGAKAGDMANIFQKRASVAAQVLSKNVDATKEFTEMLQNAGGEAETMANIKLQTLTGQMDVLRGSIDTTMATLGKAFLPVLTEVTEQFTLMSNEVTDWIEANPELIESLQEITKMFADMIIPIVQDGLEVFKDLTESFLGMTKGEQKITAAIAAIGAALLVAFVMTGPAGLAIAGISALVVGLVHLYKHSEGFRNAIDTIGTGFKAFAGFIKEVAGAFIEGGPIGAIIKVIELLKGPLAAPIGVVMDKIKEKLGSMVDWIKDNWMVLLGPVGTVYAAWTNNWFGIRDKMGGIGDKIIDGMKKVVDWFKDNWMVLLGPAGTIYAAWTNNWFGIRDTMTGLVDQMREKANAIMQGVIDGLKGWKNAALKPVDEIWIAIKDFWNTLPDKAWQAAVDIMEKWIEGLKWPIEKVKEAGGWIAGKVADFLGHSVPTEGPLANIYEAGKSITETWVQGLREGWEEQSDNIDSIADKVKRVFDSVHTSMENTLADWIKGTKSFGSVLETIWHTIADAVIKEIVRMIMQMEIMKSVMGGLGSLLGSLLGGLFGGLFGGVGGAAMKTVPIAGGASIGMQSGGIIPGGFKEFQHGGIVPGGIQPFQSGGIIRQPTVGLIGEGHQDEAVVPLEGGAIPVRLMGEQGNITVNLSFPGVRSMEDLIDNVSLLDETITSSLSRLRNDGRITGDIEVAA